MSTEQPFPLLRQVVLDCTDPRLLAEFYRELLGLHYRPGDEPPPDGSSDEKDKDWLVLRSDAGAGLAFQGVAELPEPTWPEGKRPQMLHLDISVPDAETLTEQHQRTLDLGGRLLLDRFDDPEEPLYVYADPAGHPFCIFLAPAP